MLLGYDWICLFHITFKPSGILISNDFLTVTLSKSY